VSGEWRGKNILWIGENAQIHPTASFEGRMIVGENTVVGRDVVMSGHVTVGSDCWVRPRATIKRSILLPGASVGDRAYLEDCIVGYGYAIGPGEIIRGSALTRRSGEISLVPQAVA
jgi:mannose-1-phosphate guanylyltransferase